METIIEKSTEQLGKTAARLIADRLNAAIAERGHARIVLSTGASQFTTFEALIKEDVDWSKVTMFHLDEYIDLDETHPASFKKYLKERFLAFVNVGEVVFVDDGSHDTEKNIRRLTEEIRKEPVDIGVIGIGQNAHIAFNDPPADFESQEAYFVVSLDDRCKRQQVSEGWFADIGAVPKVAITMTPHQIMSCKCIVSPVPHEVKAEAVARVLGAKQTDPMIPATLLKEHPDFYLVLDEASASRL